MCLLAHVSINGQRYKTPKVAQSLRLLATPHFSIRTFPRSAPAAPRFRPIFDYQGENHPVIVVSSPLRYITPPFAGNTPLV